MNKLDPTNKPNIDTSAAWEDYWNKTKNLSTPILWEAEPEKAAALDLSIFQEFMDSHLPLIDFACGNGKQTQFLAQHFPRVIGVDVSPAALAIAKEQYNAANIEYHVLDALSLDQADSLHNQIGDASIYMRTGLHHIPNEKRSHFVKSLKTLLGQTGTLYLIELSKASINFYNKFFEENKQIPYEFAIVMEHGLRPGTIDIEDIYELFPEFEILKSGDTEFTTTIRGQNGDFVKVPVFYAVIRRK